RLHAWWARAACELFVGAVDAIRGADRVVTDRLHAAILARIAGRPVTLLPDRFGKLSAYRDAWWLDDPAVTMAETHEP
ncbi:MAG TPA: polysaccharide pyruvyl transferase family protein, partial [Gemmatimonadales bacterium]|nr:polysaccharide pyruvyl transferase family protein [Gemmatimonadales bacterium]